MKTVLLTFLLVSYSLCIFSVWSNNPLVNTPLCSVTGAQAEPFTDQSNYSRHLTVPTSSGTIFCWYDKRSGNDDIYIQKISLYGEPQWGENGLLVCSDTGDQRMPLLCTDGADGAIISWLDYTSPMKYYLQKISSTGSLVWATRVTLYDSFSNLLGDMISDGAGGAIMTWADSRNGDADIFAQRIDGDGNLLWGTDGITVCSYTSNQQYPKLCTDGNSGAIITWQDSRSTYTVTDIYAQKVTSSGVTAWTSAGVAICAASFDQTKPQITEDGNGGAYIVWEDYRKGMGRAYAIYAQRILSGTVQWDNNGKLICDTGANSFTPVLDNNGSSGVFIGCYNNNGSSDNDVLCQYVNPDGTIPTGWSSRAKVICQEFTYDQGSPNLICDDNGHCYFVWGDSRPYWDDIYAQKLDVEGNYLWGLTGLAITTDEANQGGAIVCLDYNNNPIFVWHDNRNAATLNIDLYMQMVLSGGLFPSSDILPISLPGSVTFTDTDLEMDFNDVTGSGEISVMQFPETPTGAGLTNPCSAWWSIDHSSGITGFTTSITFSYLNYLGSLNENNLRIYRNDGSGWLMWADYTLDTINHTITANNVTEFSDWTTGEDDETLPVVLSSFTAVSTAQNFVQLCWTTQSETNLSGYSIYRNTENDFASAQDLNLFIPALNQSTEHTYSFTDSEVTAPATLYYWLKSQELNGVYTIYSPVSIILTLPGNGDNSPLPVTPIMQVYPNPFNPVLTISFKSTTPSPAQISIYSAKGEIVRTFANHDTETGEHRIVWNGKDDDGNSCSSGIYLVKLKTNQGFFSSKAVLLK